MSQISCLKCDTPLDEAAEACPECGEKVTGFQRTYGGKLIDGKYQILERLGVGGMGEIFKVRHIHLNEQRVIKIMRANIASDEQALQRFLHEARLATMIKHRNLAMLYDFSTLDDGSYYMVWEYIEGTNIQKWIATNGPMPARLAVEISIQALSGLEAIHQMGIIHRDISPENIMLSQDQMGRLLVKVIDFGIAKQLSDEGGQSGQGLTQTGMFLGKLKYASPEQAGFIKEGETLDARSDLYSFGIVMYEMLAGRAPFLATNPHGYILKHATEKPAAIHEVTPAVTVPAKLEAIVMKSLEKDRDVRQLTTGEFIQDLETIRNEIVPDSKYGLGERMMTLSSRPTAVDLRPTSGGRTGTGTAPTVGRPAPTPTATPSRPGTVAKTKPASDEATLIEQRPSPAASNEATLVERQATLSASEKTLMERTPSGAEAEATLIERSAVPAKTVSRRVVEVEEEKKSKAPMIAAAVIVLLIGGGAIGWYITHQGPKTGGDITTTTGTSGTSITATSTPASPDEATLSFSMPVGQVQHITNLATQKDVSLPDEDGFPTLLAVAPGEYRIIYVDGSGKEQTRNVKLSAGMVQKIEPGEPGESDLDSVANEIVNSKEAGQ